MTKAQILAISVTAWWVLLAGCDKSCSKSPSGPGKTLGVFFVSPADQAEVTSPVKLSFGVAGMTVRPALEAINDKTSGHHHILVDHPMGYIEKGAAIPVDARHIHYGKGETGAVVELSPGTHTLSLQFADGAHLSYGKDMSATITVKVVDPPEQQP